MRISNYLLVILIFTISFGLSAQDKKNGIIIKYDLTKPTGLDEHIKILNKLKQSNPFNRYYLAFSAYNPLLTSELLASNNVTSVAYTSRLTYEQREELYKKYRSNDNAWGSFKVMSKYRSTNSKTDDEALRQKFHDRHMYVLISEYDATQQSKDKEELMPIAMDKVDVLPEPMGGFDNFKRAVTLKTEWIDGLKHADLPSHIKFKCTIYGGNRIEGLNLVSEISGSEEAQDRVYKFLGQVRRNILDFSRDQYPWKPGTKDGSKVPVEMIFSIPKSYF